MKKDIIFSISLIIIAILLFLFKATGLAAHIAVSVLGIVLLIAYTVLTKKNWKLPALEIIDRICYGLALITGVLIINITGVAAIGIIHKICAALFTIILIFLFSYKIIKKKA